MRRTCLFVSAILLGALFLIPAAPQATTNSQSEARLWEYRNLGKAFYENPDTHQQAVEQLKKALDIAPTSVRERINYGMGLLRADQTDAGTAELLRAQKENPQLPYTWFNLGIVYKHAGDYDKAIEQLSGAIRLIPNEAIPHYNLASVYRSKGDNASALPEFLEAERLNPGLSGTHFQLFTVYQRTGNPEAAARERQLFEDVKKHNAGAAVPEDMEWCNYAELYDPAEPRPSAAAEPTRFKDQIVARDWDPSTTNMHVVDSEGKGNSDLLVWSNDRVVLYKRGVQVATGTGLEKVRDIRDIAVADFNNDGLSDLCIATGEGAAIYSNNAGVFSKIVDLPNTAGITKALAIDYDHDYDLDLLLFGPSPVLMRNNGNGKFDDATATFPFVKGKALDAVVFALRGDTAGRDIAVSYADRPGTLYRDALNGHFETADLAAITPGTAALDAQDYDHDGLLDLVAYRPEVYAIHNSNGQVSLATQAQPVRSNIRADFNGDKREDFARLLPDGTLHLYTNDSPDQHWLTLRLEGVKNLKGAANATVEVKSGAFYEKRLYDNSALAFALDGRSGADTVRITWPNGLIQNETGKKAGEALTIQEAQRLSGSCPMIFAWNGKEFQFITDVLGVAPLGASSGDGNYFPVDHDEYIQIPGSALQPVNGRYQVHITEELHEVSYLDKVQLIALDHPKGTAIYTNDKFKSPPYPEFRLFGSSKKIYPVRAMDNGKTDATSKLLSIDRSYPDAFPHDSAGVAALHTLDLDFGTAASDNRAVLILNGWVDWADGSTFLAASQNGNGGLVFPSLQVKDGSGNWQTVIADMGMPSGKPKTISVDLTGKFLSASREVRIVTNLCVYWDEIFLLDSSATPEVRLTPLDAIAADLHYRGFSRLLVDPKRQQPEQFFYNEVQPTSNWNPTEGFYTRYGDVRPLVQNVDDKLLVMGAGDEVKLQYSAAALPPIPTGWSRDFLLLVDGWAKDADANTAFSTSVLPLPFHGMTAYPYKADEHFPGDPTHQQYLREYLTRPALHLIRPLASASR